MENENTLENVKSGMVAIVGPPNAGKSTLLNSLLGQKISIVTSKPQTTRNRILGILNTVDYQIVLIDTPGLHYAADQPLNREMVRIALESLENVDVILLLIDVTYAEKTKDDQKKILNRCREQGTTPTLLVFNKIDIIEKQILLPLIETYRNLYPFEAILPISAKFSQGTDVLLKEILKHLSIGPRFFPEDIPTDSSEKFIVSEIIREKVFLLTGQEIPYASAVVIDSFAEEEKLVTIHASIVLERSSQKGIVIGKGGSKLKSIGIAARQDIEKMLGLKVLLKLWVKVKKNWSQDERFLKELGFK